VSFLGVHVTRMPREGDRKAGRRGRAEALAADWPGSKRNRSRGEFFLVCANPLCGSEWLRLWRRRDRPVFEGGWCCSRECLAAQVRAAVSRAMEGRGAPESYRHRIPLGLAMLEAGWITETGLRAALAAQRATGTGRLGFWLMRQRRATEEQVTRALGMQWSCPVLGMGLGHPEALAALAPRFFVDAFGALPLRVAADRILYLGFEERPDPSLSLAVERITGLRVESGVVEESLFRSAHERMLEARFPAVELVEAAGETALAATMATAVQRLRPVEARLARVHDCLWLRMWLRLQRGPVPDHGSVVDLIAVFARQ